MCGNLDDAALDIKGYIYMDHAYISDQQSYRVLPSRLVR
jgi:hypothetical protein